MPDRDGSTPISVAAPPLVGRERELAALREVLVAALAGRGSLVLIGGEAGIGKTALAEATLAEAQEGGALALVGRCYDLSETPPYGPWAEALERAPREDDPPPDLAGGAGAASQASLFAQVRDYLATLATRQPLVVLLDDLQWADPASLDLLRTLARQLSGLPLLILATYRAEEVANDHPLALLLPLLVREARAQRLDLRGLGAADVEAWVAGRYGLGSEKATRLAAYLQGRAGGNPLYLGELLRTLEAEGLLGPGGVAQADLGAVPVPALLQQVIGARAARLGEDARALLAVAAVVGQVVALDLWASVAKVEEDALLDAAERAVAAQLLVAGEDGATVCFAHALVREALYAGLPALRRRHLHGLAGEALAALPSPDPDAVAYHLRQAGDPQAVAWLELAGARAQRALAWLSAAERYEQALMLLEARGGDARARGWLAFRLASLRRFGDGARALDHTEAAGHLAAEAGDPLLASLATLLQGGLLSGHLGQGDRGIPLFVAGLDALAALPPTARVPPGASEPLDPARRRGILVYQLALNGRHDEAVAEGERYLAALSPGAGADWLGANPYAEALMGLGLALLGLGRPEEARVALARSREMQEAAGQYHQAAIAADLALRVAVQYQSDDLAGRRRLAAELAEMQARSAGIGSQAAHPTRAAWLPLVEGRWAEAETLAAAIPSTGPFWAVQLRASVLGRLARERGEREQGWAEVRTALPGELATEPGETYFLLAPPLQRLAADLALDAGDLRAARSWLAAHDRWLDWGGATLGRAEGQFAWAAYHRAVGNPAAARRAAAQGLTEASAPRQPLALIAAHRLFGELASADGDHAAAQAHLTEALALAEACAAPYERALILLALADLRLLEGARGEAGTALAEAQSLLEPLDARLALASADALAERLTATPPVPVPVALATRPFGLTAREVEVLRLVAEGLNDGEVAARLFLSRFTVKAHLRSVYNKLGTSSRAAATRLATERGLL